MTLPNKRSGIGDLRASVGPQEGSTPLQVNIEPETVNGEVDRSAIETRVAQLLQLRGIQPVTHRSYLTQPNGNPSGKVPSR